MCRGAFEYSYILGQIKQNVLHTLNESTTYPVYHSFEVPFESQSIKTSIDWLSSQSVTEKVFWSNRNRNLEIAGVFFSKEISGNDARDLSNFVNSIEVASDSGQEPTYIGGTFFDLNEKSDELWENFSKFHFVLPLFEVRRCEDSSTVFKCNLYIENYEEILEKINLVEIKFSQISFEKTEDSISSHFDIFSRKDYPSRDKWINNIKEVTKEISRGGDLEKVVLARKSVFHANTFKAIDLLQHLLYTGGEGFTYYIQKSANEVFFGKSPERLFRRKEDQLFCEALAGTTKAGITYEEEVTLKEKLLASSKDIEEHAFVASYVKDIMYNLCSEVVQNSKLEVKRHFFVQHLRMQFSGTLNTGVTDDVLVTSFAPTPAVAGVPTSRALDVIKKFEPFSRGWYAGAFGVLSKNEAEFCVSLRCALSKGNFLYIYTGVGVVADSEPIAEWEEMENKMSHLLEYMQK